MTTIQLNRQHLAAVSLFAAKQDIRYYLNGVLVDVLPKAVRLVATNRYCMAITHTVIEDGSEDQEPRQIIIPNDTAAAILKDKNRGLAVLLLEIDGERHSLTNVGGMSIIFKPIDGKFPDYRRVVPAKCDGTITQFNPDYLALFQKAKTKVYDSRFNVQLEHNGTSAGLVHGVNEDFIGVIMPFRAKNFSGPPAWIAGELPVAQPTTETE